MQFRRDGTPRLTEEGIETGAIACRSASFRLPAARMKLDSGNKIGGMNGRKFTRRKFEHHTTYSCILFLRQVC